jgi:hypothetical protein
MVQFEGLVERMLWYFWAQWLNYEYVPPALTSATLLLCSHSVFMCFAQFSRGYVVAQMVVALCYKPEGHGFDSW